jgi:hypothetical protein
MGVRVQRDVCDRIAPADEVVPSGGQMTLDRFERRLPAATLGFKLVL